MFTKQEIFEQLKALGVPQNAILKARAEKGSEMTGFLSISTLSSPGS